MIRYVVDAEKVQAINKIGCGDIFGVVFFYTYIKDNDVIKSLKTANEAGYCSFRFRFFNYP